MTDNISEEKQLKVVIVGHVDHGKSTLIGRLLYDTDSLPDGKADEIKAVSEKRGTDAIEWSFVLDAFQAERDQAVTIDTTQIWFSTDKRDYVIIDAPGHREFLKNMVSGAASADAAILVVDAEEGLQEQTRRHAYLLSLLGLKQVIVVINKMDRVDYAQDRFDQLCDDITAYLKSIHLEPQKILPISARHGDMIARRDDHLGWYDGPLLLNALDGLEHLSLPQNLPLRFPVQDVYRQDNKRILVGRVETGSLSVGDTISFSPTDEKAVISSIEVFPEDQTKTAASAGDCIGITLDQKIFVERGHIGSHENELPMLSNVFQANIFWLSKKPMKVGDTFTVRYGTSEAAVSVQSIDKVIDTQDLKQDDKVVCVERNAVAVVTLRARNVLALDPYDRNNVLGRVVLYDGYDIAGGGNITMDRHANQRVKAPKAQNIYEVDYLTDYKERIERNGHHGAIFWFTGLSGAGKSTLAIQVERALFKRGYHTYVLDGDNVRHGLCKDLGFSPKDRAENIRRIGHVAALQADAALITITAFISPYQIDRDRAREAAPNHFHEIFVRADLATCESRDPKGLYKKARDGEIKDFTGIGSPYEEPENPELVVDTQHNDIESCVDQVVNYIERNIRVEKSDVKKEKVMNV